VFPLKKQGKFGLAMKNEDVLMYVMESDGKP